jgi:hypothetical protein
VNAPAAERFSVATEAVWRAGLVRADVAVFLERERPLAGLRGVVTLVACPVARNLLAWHQIDGAVRSEATIGSPDGPALYHLLTVHTAQIEEAIGGLYPWEVSARGKPRSARFDVAGAIRRHRASGDGHLVVALVGGETTSTLYPAPVRLQSNSSPPLSTSDGVPSTRGGVAAG